MKGTLEMAFSEIVRRLFEAVLESIVPTRIDQLWYVTSLLYRESLQTAKPEPKDESCPAMRRKLSEALLLFSVTNMTKLS